MRLKFVFSSLIAILGISILSSCSLIGTSNRGPASERKQGSYVSYVNSTLDYKSLKNRILSLKSPTIDSLLKDLRKSNPSLFNNYTLVYQSFSLHGSSFENPRAILFGTDANLILSYNGSPSEKSFANLEIMTFDKISGFEFREIVFTKEPGATLNIDSIDIEQKTNDVVFSKPNPQVCLECHGQIIARPIWQPYPVWPGVYGSDDDNLFRMLSREEKSSISASLSRVGGLVGPDVERESFTSYQKNRLQNARYEVLSPLPDVAVSPEFMQGPKRDYADQNLDHRPNANLLMRLQHQTDQLLFDNLLKRRVTSAYLTSMVSLLCQDGENDYLRPDMIRKLDPSGLQQRALLARISRDTAALAVEDTGRIFDIFHGHVSASNSGDLRPLSKAEFAAVAGVPSFSGSQTEVSPQFPTIDADLFILLQGAGINLSDYTLSLRRGLNFANGLTDFIALRSFAFDELVRRDSKAPSDCFSLMNQQ